MIGHPSVELGGTIPRRLSSGRTPYLQPNEDSQAQIGKLGSAVYVAWQGHTTGPAFFFSFLFIRLLTSPPAKCREAKLTAVNRFDDELLFALASPWLYRCRHRDRYQNWNAFRVSLIPGELRVREHDVLYTRNFDDS